MQKFFSALLFCSAVAASVNTSALTPTAVAVHNSDMEQVARDPQSHSVRPVGWKAGGDLPFVFAAIGPSVADAASGSYFARLSTQNAASRGFWIVSDFISSSGKRQAVVNFSARTTFSDVRVSIHQFDAKWKELTVIDGAAINMTEQAWTRYAEKAGAQTFVLDPKAVTIELAFSGLAQAGVSQFDIDAVSIELR